MTLLIQIDDEIREATNEEIQVIEKIQNDAQKTKTMLENTLATKAALLERLGITEEEAKLLLG